MLLKSEHLLSNSIRHIYSQAVVPIYFPLAEKSNDMILFVDDDIHSPLPSSDVSCFNELN